MSEQLNIHSTNNYNQNIYNQISQTMGKNNAMSNANYPSNIGTSIEYFGNVSNYNTLPQEHMIKNRNIFDHSVSSLGDIYQRILKQDNRKNIEDKFNDVIIENPLFYQMNEYEEKFGDMPQYEEVINNHFSKTQNNFKRPQTATVVNNIYINPENILDSGYKPAFRTNKQALYHKPENKESKKYTFVTSGKINPPKSSFSIKQQADESKENHKKEMGKIVLHAKKVIETNPELDPLLPPKVTRNFARTNRTYYNNTHSNTFNPKESMMIIGEGCNTKHKHQDNHVIYTQPKENLFERKSVSSRKARKTLLSSEKLFGAVDDYFASNEMKIPSKNKISEIVKFSQDMEKKLNDFNKDLIKSQTKPFNSNTRYEDPFRKKLKNKKGLIKPKPRKVYPEIDDHYKRTIKEKMSILQIELRQIFDNITQVKESNGDDIKLNDMINKAKELTGMISHLAKDIKDKEIEFKQSMKMKKSVSPKKTTVNNNTTKNSTKVGGSNNKQMNTNQRQNQRPKSAVNNNTNIQNKQENKNQVVNKTSPTFPTFKNNSNNDNSRNNMTNTILVKPVNNRATIESTEKSKNILRSTGFNPIIEESQDLRNSNLKNNNYYSSKNYS